MPTAQEKKKKLFTPVFRLSFPDLFVPKAFEEGKTPMYGCTMIFPKNADLSELKQAAHKAMMEKWPDKETRPRGLKQPFRDGAEKAHLAGYGADTVFISARTKIKPGIVEPDGDTHITSEEGIYPGCYCRATVNAYWFDKPMSKGVTFGLGNVQFLKHGDPLSSRSKAEDDFEPMEAENPFDEQEPIDDMFK